MIWHEQVLQIVLFSEIHFGRTKFSCNMINLITDKIGLFIKNSKKLKNNTTEFVKISVKP